MDPTNNILSCCVLCLRDSLSCFKTDSNSDVQNDFLSFFKLFARFVKVDKKQNLGGVTYSDIGCCAECLPLIEKFCDFYNQYKCMELQLDCLIWKIERIMRHASKVNSRILKVKNKVHDFDTIRLNRYEKFDSLREQILQNCQQKLNRSLPRVSLQRNESRLPLRYDAIPLTNLNEALNVHLDTYSRGILDECEIDYHFEETFNNLDDNDITANSENVESAEELPNKDVIHTSDIYQNPTSLPSHLAVESAVTTDLVICKMEPLNQEIVPTGNEFKRNNKSCLLAANSTISRQRYSLRKKSTRNTKHHINSESDDEDSVDNRITNLDNSCNISSPSSSETSSESSLSSEDDYDLKPNQLLSPITKTKRKKRRKKCVSRDYFYCKFPNCMRKFEKKDIFETHVKLHAKGQFTCKFCSKAEPDLVMLSKHEYFIHGNGKNDVSVGKRKMLRSCPRCHFVAYFVTDYEAHFASSHFGVGAEPRNRRTFEKCKICNRNVWDKYIDIHFKAFHDIKKLSETEVKKCKMEGCSAYFVKYWQRISHYNLEHNLKTRRGPKLKTFQCSICLRTFSNQIMFLNHKRRLHTKFTRDPTEKDKNVSTAEIPQEKPEQKAILQFKCKFCPVIKEKPQDLAIHEAEQHSALETLPHLLNSQKPNRCPRCPYRYKLKGSFLKHHLRVHQNVPDSDRPSACKICSGKNFYRKNCESHFKNFHRIDNGKEPHKCDKCTAYFRKPTQLKKHKIRVHPERRPACKLCSGGKVYQIDSKRHFKAFHKIDDGTEPNKCEKCPAYFRQLYQLQAHIIRIHQQDNECEICGKGLKNRFYYNLHMKNKHPGNDEDPNLPIACDFGIECKKRFGTQAEMEYHKKYGHLKPKGWSWAVKNNGNVKPKCDKCDEEFTGWSYLRTHSMKKHGIRLYVCDECGKAFKTQHALNSHSEFHKRPEEWKWQCGECGKRCATKQKFEEHQRTHTKEKPFICQFCGERYAHRHNWRNHLKTKHGNEDGVHEIVAKQMKGNYVKWKGTKKGDCIMANK